MALVGYRWDLFGSPKLLVAYTVNSGSLNENNDTLGKWCPRNAPLEVLSLKFGLIDDLDSMYKCNLPPLDDDCNFATGGGT